MNQNPMSAPSPLHTHDAIITTLLVAFGLHAFLILAISFDIDPKNTPIPERTLDITLAPNVQSTQKNDTPDFLAQITQQGGGDEVNKSRPSSPLGNLSATPKPQIAPELKPSGVSQPQPKKQPTVITQYQSAQYQMVNTETDVTARQQDDWAQIFASTQKEIDQLTAELDNRNLPAARQPRRKAINASTQEYLYANYLDAWRKKIERIGNLHYPDEARRKKLYGDLLLHVAIRADGSLQNVRLVRTSKHKILDDAAIRIVRLAAPFAAFPPNLREQVDVLDITRTWRFSQGQKLRTR